MPSLRPPWPVRRGGAALRLEGADLRVGPLAKLRIRLRPRHLLDLGQLLEGLLVGAVALHDGGDVLRLAREPRVGRGVLDDRRVGHGRLDLAEATFDLLQLLEGDRVHRGLTGVCRWGAPPSGAGRGRPLLRVLAGEALDAPRGVDQLLLSGEEGGAAGADLQAQLLLGRAGGPRCPAGAVNGDGVVLGMYSSLHGAPRAVRSDRPTTNKYTAPRPCQPTA